MKLAVLLLAELLVRQSVAARISSRTFPAEYVFYDARRNAVVLEQFSEPVPVGSLMKPFLAVARKGPYPVLECDRSQCWRSHGRIGMKEAIAHSCNSYFLQWLHDTSADDLNPGLQAMGLPAFASNATARTFIGLEGDYRVAPEALLRAFAYLTPVHDALKLAVEQGTLKLANIDAIGKTGTAACTHARKEQGDGFALLWSPEWAVLVRQHNTNGSTAAITAGEILRTARGTK
jgi:cell division protein FtsI/penicillin-binding protein 2